MVRRPRGSTRTGTHFPDTRLFRSTLLAERRRPWPGLARLTTRSLQIRGSAAGRARRSGLVGFPPIGRARPVARRDLVHRQRIIEVSAEHYAVDFLGIADVLRRIGVEDHEVGELARLERPDILRIAQ